MDETKLIKLAKDGDLDAFNRLVLDYESLAYNVALRLVGEPSLSEDATQEAFISAYRKLNSFRGGSFKAWLMRIVTNACYDELRRQKRRPVESFELRNKDGEEVDRGAWIMDPGESPEEFSERIELGELIQSCLDRLDLQFRTAIVLVDVQGFDYAEAAKSVGKSIGTMKSRLFRGRKKLQDCLQGFEELLPAKYRLKAERSV